MIFKYLILFIILNYVQSILANVTKNVEIPINKVSVDTSLDKETVQHVPTDLFIQSKTENDSSEKLTRVMRNDKAEYVYLNKEGEIFPAQDISSKNSIDRLAELPTNYHLSSKEDIEKIVLKDKEGPSIQNTKSTSEGSISDDKVSDSLHYSSGVKMLGESRGSALPSSNNINLAMNTSPQIESPSHTNDANFLQSLLLTPTYLSPISHSYPTIFQLIQGSIPSPSISIAASDTIPNNRLLTHSSINNLSPYSIQYISSPLSFTHSQQMPNVNYLLTKNGLIGLSNIDLYAPNNIFSSIGNQLPVIRPNTITHLTSLIPNYYPRANQNSNNLLIVSQMKPINQELITRRVLVPSSSAINEGTTTKTSLPFSDSSSQTITIPEVAHKDADKSRINSDEKISFYSTQNSNQNVPLRLHNDNNFFTNSNPNRFVDVTYASRYPVNILAPPYSRPSYYPNYPLGSYYRLGAINPYYQSIYSNVYGPFNGVGYISPMHYSAN